MQLKGLIALLASLGAIAHAAAVGKEHQPLAAQARGLFGPGPVRREFPKFGSRWAVKKDPRGEYDVFVGSFVAVDKNAKVPADVEEFLALGVNQVIKSFTEDPKRRCHVVFGSSGEGSPRQLAVTTPAAQDAGGMLSEYQLRKILDEVVGKALKTANFDGFEVLFAEPGHYDERAGTIAYKTW